MPLHQVLAHTLLHMSFEVPSALRSPQFKTVKAFFKNVFTEFLPRNAAIKQHQTNALPKKQAVVPSKRKRFHGQLHRPAFFHTVRIPDGEAS